MSQLRESIEQRGWGEVVFEFPEADIAQYARAANLMIELALESPRIKEAFKYDLFPERSDSKVRTGTFGVDGPRNSTDEKVYLHTGFRSREHAHEVYPEHMQPKEMRDFWKVNREMMTAAEESMISGLAQLGATSLNEAIFPKNKFDRNVHLRTVRYINATDEEAGSEVVSGHSDLGLATLHLYETHGGWFKGARYSRDLISDDTSEAHKQAIREMRKGLIDITHGDREAIFFLGANWHTFPDTPVELRGLPACYHAGFKPTTEQETVSQFTDEVTMGRQDRVSVIVFAHPEASYLRNNLYVPATVPMCRPEYE